MSKDSSEPLAPQKAVTKAKTSKAFHSPPIALGLVLVIFFISQILAFVSVQIVLAIVQPGVEHTLESFERSPPQQFFYVLLAVALTITSVLLVLRAKKLKLADIGFGRRIRADDIKYALIGFFAYFALLIIVTTILTSLVPGLDSDEAQDVGFKALFSQMDKILAFVALVFLPPIGEETLMRGYLFTALRSRWQFIPTMIITSLLFGVAHLGTGDTGLLWVAAVSTVVLAIVLAYLREKTGALWAPMMVHGANNLVAFFVYIKLV